MYRIWSNFETSNTIIQNKKKISSFVVTNKGHGFQINLSIGFIINNLFIPAPPVANIQQSSYTANFGSTITLICFVTSNLPVTSVFWQRNIGGSVTTITSNTNTGKYSGSTSSIPSLTIFNAVSSDAGFYTCFASNSVGTGQSSTTQLSVVGSMCQLCSFIIDSISVVTF